MVETSMGLGCPELVCRRCSSRAGCRSAAEFYGHPSRELTVVGITGTDGKTTTSYLLDAIAREAGKRTGMIGTIAIKIDKRTVADETRQTTPESHGSSVISRTWLTPASTVAIIEATSHGLDLHRLDSVRFEIGGVTNITHEHLEHHKTISAYRRAKAKLFERVGESRGASPIINLDDEGATEMIPYADGARVLTYRCGAGRDFCAEAIDLRGGWQPVRSRLWRNASSGQAADAGRLQRLPMPSAQPVWGYRWGLALDRDSWRV